MLDWFAVNMPDIDFQDIYYYLKPATAQVDEWEDLPEEMRNTYEKLGIPEAERKYLAVSQRSTRAKLCFTATVKISKNSAFFSAIWILRFANIQISLSNILVR